MLLSGRRKSPFPPTRLQKYMLRTVLTIYAPMIYTALCVMLGFDAGSTHYLGKWKGVGPWKSRFFWAL
jgi:hypothetical protein